MDELSMMLKGPHTYNSLMDTPFYKLEYIIQSRINKVKKAKIDFDETGIPNIYMQDGTSSGMAASLISSMIGGVGGKSQDQSTEPERVEFSESIRRRKQQANGDNHMTQADMIQAIRNGNMNNMGDVDPQADSMKTAQTNAFLESLKYHK